jgi:hypothetical protein
MTDDVSPTKVVFDDAIGFRHRWQSSQARQKSIADFWLRINTGAADGISRGAGATLGVAFGFRQLAVNRSFNLFVNILVTN